MYSGDDFYDDDVTSGLAPAYELAAGERDIVSSVDLKPLEEDDEDTHDHEIEEMALGFMGDPAREHPYRAVCRCGTVLMFDGEGWEPE